MTESQVLTKEELRGILQQAFISYNYHHGSLISILDFIGLTVFEQLIREQLIQAFLNNREDALRIMPQLIQVKFPQFLAPFRQRLLATLEAIQSHFGYRPQDISIEVMQDVLMQLSQG
jgi:Mg2+/Co2+ transporter CorB